MGLRKVCLAITLLFIIACHGHSVCYAQAKPFRVLASTFPIYIFVANICANIDNVQTELLIPAQAGCPHDFALKPGDLLKLTKASVLVINGAHLEEFLDKPLQNLENPVPVIDASQGLELLESGRRIAHHGHEHQEDYNPHIFASPQTAALMVANIGAALANLDPVHADAYQKNADAYIERLNIISKELIQTGVKAVNKKIALEHDALAYLAQNAGLTVIAMFENSDSVSALSQLKKVMLAEMPALLAGDVQFSDRLLQTLSRETKIPWAVLNPCASGPQNPPLDYYEQVMKDNLKILEKYFD